MNKIKWFFMSKHKKLLYTIKIAKENKQRLHLPNGIILDFKNDVPVCLGDRVYCKNADGTFSETICNKISIINDNNNTEVWLYCYHEDEQMLLWHRLNKSVFLSKEETKGE